MKRLVFYNVCIVFTITTCMRCSMSPIAGGGGSDIGNGVIAGIFVMPDGSPALNVSISVQPTTFNPAKDASPPVTRTGASGEYEVDSLQPGTYNIEARDPISKAASLITGIVIAANSRITVPIDTLRPPGSIKILTEGIHDAVNGYIYLPGTSVWSSIAADAYTIIDGVPAGTISLIYYDLLTGTYTPQVLEQNVIVISGDTTDIFPFSTWQHSMRLYLNTTSTGADIQSDCHDFPVLVRLRSSNFTFNEAKRNGDDIRFSTADSTPLPYEIEDWDYANNTAEIWVQVNTVYGNNNSQYIIMYWGNDSAHTIENGGCIFDTTDGFQAVWHFSPSDTFTDATWHGLYLVNNGSLPVSSTPIGWCRSFDSASLSTPHAPCLNITRNLSLSAWINSEDSLFNHKIIGKGVGQKGYILGVSRYGALYPEIWDMQDSSVYFSFQAGDLIALQQWIHIAVTWEKNGTMKGYVNGIEVASIPASMNDIRSSVSDLVIGAAPWDKIQYPFHGLIDEVRVANVARSADWMKLCYMNQKALDALVSFQK